MKPLLLVALLLALPDLAAAQCYTAYRDLGKKLVQEKKYDEAIAKFQKAKGCRSDKPADGDKLMNDLIAEARKLKAPPKPPNPKPANPKPQSVKPTGPTPAEKEAAAASRADDDAWDIAQGTLTGCRRYLDKYEKKNGRHVPAARQCVRDYSDDDSDGMLNKDDRCPSEKGTAAYDGCPPPAKPRVETVPTDPSKCANCPEMVPVQGGTYTMGCQGSSRDGECYDWEKPPHEVTVQDFYIGKYEVTQAEWRRVMGSNPPELYNTGCDQCPVERVSWNDVQEFIKKLNAQTGKNYRLPTEAEWEYAARGGAKSKGYLYSGSNTVADVAWYDGNAKSGNTNGSQKTTRPVGTRVANELGIHDMSGNVWEWVEDDWHGNFSGAPTDGRAWVDSSRASNRVGRGGSWVFTALHCRAAYRYCYTPANRSDFIGFRLALQL
jgi:formylglycine-generating enzyme required for sulfatase activity